MNERITALCKLTLNGEMLVEKKKTEFDRNDIFLEENERDVKRICEYILNQEPKLTEYQTMTGFFDTDGSVVGDAFRRYGHRHTAEVLKDFYLKAVDNLVVMEWQHATADYKKVLEKGIVGIIDEIDASIQNHNKEEKAFLTGLRNVALTLIAWCEKCSARVLEFSATVENPQYRANLEKLSNALLYVPKNAPRNFYEACLCIYICFSADPDSLGTLDRYLSPFYFSDLKTGIIDKDQAREYLQELFLMIQAATSVNAKMFTRGGESHFCIGGYLPDGSDAYNDLSKLILESLTDLPTYIPQVTLRWTKTQPREVLRFAMDLERKDKHKRIAFQNDEKRIKCYTEICGFDYKDAVNYTTVGCNEPAFLGGITGSTTKINILKSMETVFHKKGSEIENSKTFDEFYSFYTKELFIDLDKAYAFDDKCNSVRARDINYLSSLFFKGCIEKAKSATQGAGDTIISSPMCLGITNVIDSLIVVKQFVYDEQIISMKEFVHALQNNWKGYEELYTLIKKKGDFFGNDTERSNDIARRFYDTLYAYLKGKKNIFGYQILIGDLLGYHPHHKWFGENTKATPDGRCNGDLIKYGLGQSGGNDREGLSALLNSIAIVDPNGIGCGSTVTNISLDETLIKNDDNFEKTVTLFENYFKMGGVHFQLNYVSREELMAAKECPEDYKNLRVRVTGFSDYFVKLDEAIQDDIIARTEQK